jgi:hypothetical protein
MVAMVVLSLSIAIASQPSTNSNVRSSSPSIAALLEQGQQESPTFAGLVAELDRHDVIVYVQSEIRLRAGLGGATNHTITTRGQVRYLRVLIDLQRSRERLIGLIAHELQHVLEIARDPTVVSEADVDALFRRIGFRRPGGSYETDAARNIQTRVIDEALAYRRSR